MTQRDTRKYAPNRLKEIRHEKKMTLVEVAARFDPPITAGTVHKLESLRMALSLDYIYEFSRIFETHPAAILDACSTDALIELGTPRKQINHDKTICVPIPIRNGMLVNVSGLPVDVTHQEIQRIDGVLSAYVVETGAA